MMSKKRKIICINGHPRSGKDTMGDIFIQEFDNLKKMKMAQPIGDALKATFDMPDSIYDYYREDGKSDIFPYTTNIKSLTFRDLMINYGENFLKDSLGDDVFGSLLGRRITHQDENCDIIITDIGFQSEFDTFTDIIENYNKLNHESPFEIYFYRVNRPSAIPKISLFLKLKRFILRAKNFIGDSRVPVYADITKSAVIKCDKEFTNEGTLQDLKTFVKNEIEYMEL